MQSQQGVLFRDLLVVQNRLGSMKAFFQDRLQRLKRFVSGDMPFSVRRDSCRFIILETVYAKRQFFTKNRGENVYDYSMAGAAP